MGATRFLAAGFVCLLAVNVVFGAGLFGVPTNGDLSDAYSTHVTPAGFTFSIWGPIFLLQAVGTAWLACGKAPKLGEAVAPMWLGAWASEVLWQSVFAFLPVPAEASSKAHRLLVLLPCLALLCSAYGFMLAAQLRLRKQSGVGLPESVFLLFATGLNNAWLAAATGIGLSLVAQLVPGLAGLATERGGAVLLALVVSACVVVVLVMAESPRALGLSLGYAAGTSWACFGMTKGLAPAAVKAVARWGIWVAPASAVLAVGRAALARRAVTEQTEHLTSEPRWPASPYEHKQPTLA